MTLLEFLEKYWVFLLNGVIFPAFWYALGKTFAHKSELDAEKKRISTLENKVESQPSMTDFHELSKKMVSIDGELKSINKDIVHITKNLDLLVQAAQKSK